MIARLQTGAGEREWASLLPGLPVPRAGGVCELYRVAAQALAYTGYPGAWGRLMALSGEAVAPPLPCPLSAPGERPERRVLTGLTGMGFRENRLVTGPEGLPGPEIVRAVLGECGAGRPVVLRGWAPHPHGLSLIAGLGPGGLLCGYTPDATAGEPYLAAPPSGDLLLMLGPPSVPAEGLFAAAVAVARAQWEEARPGAADRYRAWIYLAAVGEGAALTELAAGLSLLVEARAAAGEFLGEVLPDLGSLPAAWVRRALGQYELLANRAEPLAERLSAPGLVLTPEERAGLAGALETLAELDAEAANCLRRAPSADYPPG